MQVKGQHIETQKTKLILVVPNNTLKYYELRKILSVQETTVNIIILLPQYMCHFLKCVFHHGQNEESIRRTIWEKNMLFIEAHNKEYELGIHTYDLGMNHFGDMVSTVKNAP